VALAQEIVRAREKFPSSSGRFAALGEEFGELSKAFLEGEGASRIRAEAIQVACTAMRIYEEGDPDMEGLPERRRASPKYAPRWRGLPSSPSGNGNDSTLTGAHWARYRASGVREMRPYVEGETLPGTVSISPADKAAGSPKAGDMIARNPDNPEDQWLVSSDYFAKTFVPV
jgi:hypothetical protein